ncbi:MAG TPA: hypothetical protein PK156_46770 [Polyangium sp.]|nr:hypothetical protein [Polyangium sp.]
MLDILTNTGAPMDINQLLANPFLQTSGWNGNMAVGASIQDPDLAALQQLIATSGLAIGGMNMAIGGGPDIYTGASIDPNWLALANMNVGAPVNAAQAQAQNAAQMRAGLATLMKQNQQLQQALAQKQAADTAKLGTKAALVDRDPDKYSYMLLPVNSNGTIAPFTTVVVQAEPQYHFKPKILKFPNGGFWLIGDVKVGARSQFAGSGTVPGEMFGETATDVHLIGDTATPGQKIYVTVTNNSGAARPFIAGLLGHVVS